MMYRLVSIALLALVIIDTIIILYMKKRIKYKTTMIDKKQQMASKNDRLFRMALKWAEKNTQEKCVYSFLKARGYSTILVYGMHYAGELVVEELMNSDIQVVCGVDQNAEKIVSFVKTIHPHDEFPVVDAIIVTAVDAFPLIEEKLIKKVSCPIISLEDIIYD